MTYRGTMLGALLCSTCLLAQAAWAADSTGAHGKPAREVAADALAQAAPPTGAPPITINFTGDSSGAKPNGFASGASSAVTFSDTKGAGLSVSDFGEQSRGQALAVDDDFDDSGLRITLARPTTRISIAFGNDDPSFSDPGDEAVLTLFRGTTTVGQVRVTMNRNDKMDQTISYGPLALFNRAELKYDVNPSQGLVEVVDDIVIGALCTIAGTEGPNRLTGTDGPDVICGGGGNDIIVAKGGNDTIFAGLGNDTVDAGPGNDVANGGLGNDTIAGGPGSDRIAGNEGNDKCDGGAGTDVASTCETRVGFP